MVILFKDLSVEVLYAKYLNIIFTYKFIYKPILNSLRIYFKFIIICLFKGCFNWNYFLNDGLDI